MSKAHPRGRPRAHPNADLLADPFHEHANQGPRKRLRLLGADFSFESRSPNLMRMVDSAYRGLPSHRLSTRAPLLRVKLVESPPFQPVRSEPPPVTMLGTHSLVGGATPASDLVILSPREKTALVVASPAMLRSAYHTRYELIEFAVFTLAARAQGLVALHAACVGHQGRGVLLLGDSGAGKSTLALHSALRGLDFLSEDGVFVEPHTLKATGIANFLHVGLDARRWLERPRDVAMIDTSPVIRRRSGVRKVEIDMRRRCRLAATALRLNALVFLSASAAGRGPLMRALPRTRALQRLERCQAYARHQPHWHTFARQTTRLDAFELRRGRHPRDAAAALCEMLECASL